MGKESAQIKEQTAGEKIYNSELKQIFSTM